MSELALRHAVIMGVSGSGKSTVGAELARATGLEYVDGDDLHSAAAVAKMRSGTALDDDDRWPWLDRCGAALRDAGGGLILGCSALRRRYRDRLRAASGRPDLVFVHLAGSPALLRARMTTRPGHYMPASLLDSQLAALEPPEPDEAAITLGIGLPLAGQVALVLDRLRKGG